MSSQDDRAEAADLAEQCLAALRAGNREGDRSLLTQRATEHIYCAFDKQLGRVAYQFLSNVHDGEDAVQEYYKRVIRAFLVGRSLPRPGRLKPWLLRVLANVCLDELRSRKKRTTFADLDDVTELTDKAAREWNEGVAKNDPLSLVVKADLVERRKEVVKEYFQRLKEEEREWEIEMILLRAVGLKTAAICDMLNSDDSYETVHPSPFDRNEVYRAVERYTRMIRRAVREENED